jgi:uncharacterized protein
MKFNAQYWIEKLALSPHPEGGYFRETYRSTEIIPQSTPGLALGGARNVSTAIFFLLNRTQCSTFHRIQSDELWHFHTGSTLAIHMIRNTGELLTQRLGPDFESGDRFQAMVPAGCWFGAEVLDKSSFGLCSCTVAPGFDFDDFELADTESLSAAFPRYRDLIHRMAG